MAKYDFFISHASADKAKYVDSLAEAMSRKGLRYWLDTQEISWGDSIAMKINDGLRESRFVLLCLSSSFLSRPWPETELSATLAIQNTDGVKRVLPLILDSKDQILKHYPILAGFAYKNFAIGVVALAEELATLVQISSRNQLSITAQSVYSPKSRDLLVDPRSSIKWLSESLQRALGVSNQANSGAPFPFMLRWILVDSQSEDAWQEIPRTERRRIHAVVKAQDGLRISYSDRDRLEDLGVYNGIIFHLYPIEEDSDSPMSAPPAKHGF